jgi:hypothetical protein
MVIGRLENPKIVCLRQLYHHEGESMVLPLHVKANVATQKYRIPFKNMNANLDADVEFQFVK